MLTTKELIKELKAIIVVHPKAAEAVVHVNEAGRDEGVLHAIRYKQRPNIIILEGDPNLKQRHK